jgi:hypothetical protein
LKAREDAGIIQPGWTVRIAVQPPPSDNDTWVALDYEVQFSRDVQQILNNVTVG